MFVKLAEHHLLRSLSGLCEVNVVGIHGTNRVLVFDPLSGYVSTPCMCACADSL